MKESLKDLTNELNDIQEEVKMLAELDIDSEHLDPLIEQLQRKIARKAESIDFITVSLEIAEEKLKTLAQIYENEAKNAKERASSVAKNKDRLIQYLGETGLVSKDTPLRTGAHTYFLKSSHGALELPEDLSLIPEEYKETRIEQVINKGELRKDIIAGKVYVEGASVPTTIKVARR